MALDVRYGLQGALNTVVNIGNSARIALTGDKLLAVRVKHIILSNNDPNFQTFGEWNGIGTIFWDPVDQPIPKDGYNIRNFATPLFSNIKQYPLLNEIVYLVQLPNTNIATNVSNIGYYYLPPINMWNSQHHNAMPASEGVPNQVADYDSAIQGEVRRPEDNSSEINLGNTFVEKLNIHPLLPYEGDVIYEGRWGNSIRLGSTVKNANNVNEWSTTGNNGDPLTIIRNGQTNYKSDPWVPETEKIETDLSSIYLTSTQKLPIPSITSTKSFKYQATGPNAYDKNQIALSSGRIFLGAKTDSIILKADKPVQISSNTAVNIEGSKQIVLDSNEILLGLDPTAQPVVLGTELKNTLLNIATILKGVGVSLQGAVDSNGAIIAACQSAGSILVPACDDMIDVLNSNTILSKKVKTI
jgi:hypothetical protein